MNLYIVRKAGWGVGYTLVEAASEEEAIIAAGANDSPLYPPEVERIDLQGRSGIRWIYEHSPATPSE